MGTVHMKPVLIRRQEAIEKTQARFGGKAFKIGSNDCVKLVRFHLHALGVKVPSTGNYATPAGAVAQLKKQGVRNLRQLMDKYLERIPPAARLPGDIVLLKSDPDAPCAKLGTVTIALGQKLLGYHGEAEGLVVMEPLQIEAAWRALK